MAHPQGHQRIAAIVPAFDEERDIAGVLREISSYEGFDEVIVVDDGSQDATARVAAAFPVRVIRHDGNRGKGQAMQTGVEATDADILFFCDADMRGLSHALLESVLAPVVRGETDMVIAMRNWRMYYAGFVLSLVPILGGQRAVRRALWEQVPRRYKERFMIETALNFYARYWGNGYQYKVVSGLTQTIKERKYGLWRGFTARLAMSAEVILTQVRLQFAAVPADLRTGRIALANALVALAGAMLGALVIFASYYGPVALLRDVYADSWRSADATPFLDILFYFATSVSADAIAVIGIVLLAANAFFAGLNAKNLRFLAYPRSPAQRIG